VTGGVENGESTEEAVFREVLEETGIKKKDIKRTIKDINYFEFKSNNPKENKGIIVKEYVFGFEVDKGTNVKIDPIEHDEYGWFPFEKATELLKWDNNKDSLENLRTFLEKTE